MKKSLLLVIALLCIASLMASMAFSTASVLNNRNTVRLTNTDDALLALKANPDDHNASTYHSVTSRILKLDLNRGYGEKDKVGSFGIQPFSSYTWDKLFFIKNNSEYKVTVEVKVNASSGVTDFCARVNGDRDWKKLHNRASDKIQQLTFELSAGEEKAIDFMTDRTQNGREAAQDFDILVEAVKY